LKVSGEEKFILSIVEGISRRVTNMPKFDIKGASKKQRSKIKKACIENSKWLLMQARDQFRIGNYNLSAFLAITSYEESLKSGLLGFYESKLLNDTEFGQIASCHLPKLLSKYSAIQIRVMDKKLSQKLIRPIKPEYFKSIVKEILAKRENASYMDFKNSVLNIPNQMNPSEALEEIDRAFESIESETFLELLNLSMKKKRNEIRNQKIASLSPKLI